MVAVSLGMNVGIQALTGGPGRYAPIFPILVVVTLFAGLGPGVLHLVLTLLAIDYLWVPPVGQLWPIEERGHLLALLALTLASAAIIAVSDIARRSVANHRRTRADLERARARLDVLHHAARVVEWEWDLGSDRVQMSRSARSVFGAAWSAAGGSWSLVHPDDRARVEATVADAVARGEDYAFTSRLIRPDCGDTRWIETRAVMHRGPSGAPTHVTGVTIDVTDRQEALETARVAEHRFQLALEGSSIVAWACDAERRYIWVHNPSAVLRKQEIIGQRVGSLLPKDQYSEYAEALDRVWRTGTGERLPISWTHEGTTRHYLSSIEPVKSDDGVVTGMVGASVDVTEERRMDAALRDSEQRLRLALEGAQVGMWIADLATGLTECTPLNYELYGFDPQSPPLPVDTWFQAIHPDDRPQVQAAWASTVEHGAPFALEYRILRPDGVVRWLDVRARLHRDGAQAPARVLGISMDVTGRKDAEVALREAGRSKDEFLATLAHELRNPLAPLRTAAYLLNSPGLGDGARRDAQQMIERQVGHLSRLVDDLLEVSRVTLGRIELLREPVSVALVVEHAVEAARTAIEEGGHRLQLEIPATPLWVDADLVRLSQVYTNLLTNAARYTPAGGQITLRVYARGGDAVVSVEDTGIGIAPEMLGHVFEMFVQVPHGDRARHGGLGIGLALSKRLVELHGGTIEAWSQGEGCGSEFRVLLPRAERPRAEAKAVERLPVVAEGRRILVVDDNVDAALSLAILLELLGHEVETVHDGHDALKRITTEPFHVVLLDIGMPTLNGYDVARLVRERMGARAPKLVALTGWGQSADRARSAEAGFDHHLLKPADPGVIAQVIEALAGANGH